MPKIILYHFFHNIHVGMIMYPLASDSGCLGFVHSLSGLCHLSWTLANFTLQYLSILIDDTAKCCEAMQTVWTKHHVVLCP